MTNIIKLTDIVRHLKPYIKEIYGDINDVIVDNIPALGDENLSSLNWIKTNNPNQQKIAELSLSKVLIVGDNVEYSEKLKAQEKVLLVVNEPKICIAIIANIFFINKPLPLIHPSAIVHSDAIIGNNVFIGPHCIIGKCAIGNNVTIEGNNYLYDNVVIGNHVEIHAGAIIGSEAHNYVEDEYGNKIKFPHLGKTIIGNHVDIGAQSVICRGVLSDTIVGDNTKIAQLVVIGANNIIHENCAIRANAVTSGSVTIGKNSIIAPSVTIRNQNNIGENCFIGMGAVVTKNIPDGETWIGNPARKLR